MSGDHDTGYKLLFSHPEMVRDLLLGYVPGEWIRDMRRVIRALGDMLSDEAMQPLRRTLNIWLKSLLKRKTPA